MENVVRVYNIQTGDCTRVLETEKPVKELIAIQFPENQDYNLFACSDTGYVIAWTWENGVVLRETVSTPLSYIRSGSITFIHRMRGCRRLVFCGTLYV